MSAIASLILIVPILAMEMTDICIQQDFTLRQMKCSFAAEVLDLGLEHATDNQFQLLEHYLSKYPVLVFRNQSSLTVEGQRSFSLRFGPLQSHIEQTSHLPGYIDVNVISNLRKDSSDEPLGLYGDHVENFHADLSWSLVPSKVTILKSVILPLKGGETLFSHTVQAYKMLSEEVKMAIDNLRGHYSYLKYRAEILDNTDISVADREYLLNGAEHPLVSMHPVTGEENLLANSAHLVKILNVTEEESAELIDLLLKHVEKENFQCAHHWQVDDVLLWDNRAVQHRASPSPSSPRQLVRTTVLQQQPPQRRLDRLYPTPPPPCLSAADGKSKGEEDQVRAGEEL